MRRSVKAQPGHGERSAQPDPLLDRVAIGEHLFEVGVFKAKRPGQLVKAAVVLELAQVVAAPRAPPHHMMAIDPRAKCREHRREPFSGVQERKSTRLNYSQQCTSRMPSSA